MPAAVFDFPAIAARLRKDDFFIPAPKAELIGIDLAEGYCAACDSSEENPAGGRFCPACKRFT